jgi:hypothetical protein
MLQPSFALASNQATRQNTGETSLPRRKRIDIKSANFWSKINIATNPRFLVIEPTKYKAVKPIVLITVTY